MGEIRFFNTLTRKKAPFVPLVPGRVTIYSCGPTVYNYIHIGNLRTFLWGDLLRRYLEWKGFAVTSVMNLTDVDDKIIRGAIEKGVDLDTFTAPYATAFFEDIDTLRLRRADVYPRATEHIAEMVALVEQLTAGGHTYQSEGSTYFKISTFDAYGRLAGLDLTQESDFTRIENDEYEKDNARDFVLWKLKKEGEASWSVSLGEGRPGWHLECSAMSIKYLGETFDIHTGAVDLIFPHHENEIAQSEAATGKPFVQYWLHGEHLIVEDRKMSKSLGNVYTLRELLTQGYAPLQIRYALLAIPYRTKLSFTLRSLDDAKQALERLEQFMRRLRELAGDAAAAEPLADSLAAIFLRDFEEAMDDDLNTAAALGALFTLVREANIALDEKRLVAADCAAIIQSIEKADTVLDILPIVDQAALDSDVEQLIEARLAARKERNFAESDRLRDELLARGIILEDTPAGTRWRRK